MRSDTFFFVSINKFGNFKSPIALITSPYGLYFRCGRFILLIQTKEVNPMGYSSSTNS